MRQTFTFAESTHKPPQALAALKFKLRKYLKRELGKPLPEGADRWEFDCRVGAEQATAEDVQMSDVIDQVGAVFETGSPTVYVEILARPGKRKPRFTFSKD